jgi:peptidoglycan/xylan/chitin deacetylase (PgdA/CDA1 family)
MMHNPRFMARRWLRVASIAATLSLSGFGAHADTAGPSLVAKADFHLWPEPVNTLSGFDKASRAALLVYVQALQDARLQSDADMQATFKIKSFNRTSVDKWIKKELDASLANYQLASKNCAQSDWTCVGQVSSVTQLSDKAKVLSAPSALANWRDNLGRFTQVYVAEQLRLAALFPKVSSEIDRFNDGEWMGDVLPDRQFYLTLDDGPTQAGGNTDDTLKMLAAQKKSAAFFMLGQNLQGRLAHNRDARLADQYKGQCIASHGWEHQSHAKWDQWEDSIKRTQSLLKDSFPAADVLPIFRPPYGQRKADSGAFFQAQGLRVALWNLDSQDWNSHVTPDDILNRMLTLMLLKRHGVLLFHDIHPKAQASLPRLFEQLGQAVDWGDCHQLSRL